MLDFKLIALRDLPLALSLTLHPLILAELRLVVAVMDVHEEYHEVMPIVLSL